MEIAGEAAVDGVAAVEAAGEAAAVEATDGVAAVEAVGEAAADRVDKAEATDGVAAVEAVGEAVIVEATDGVAVNCEAADSRASRDVGGKLANNEAASGVTVFIALPKLLVISSKPSLFT